ncbi:hypothetical protein GcM3_207046 [Golovinomyces cichoracearum]|uniref:Uncharacterized protein n=1 Tax=Golovinomyces cichoracearum TaxID=62708 RepID=A0A420HB66_9PEZI|nr:hypothetical protein GcM3_207046 [Golovinomyces cichoracearum]
MCIEARVNIKASTIHNCFQYCAIRTTPSDAKIITEATIEEPALVQELNQQIRQFAYSNPIDINFLIKNPSEDETFILSIDEEIFQQFDGEEEPHHSLEEMDDSQEPQKKSPSETLKLLDSVKVSLLQQNGNHRENLARPRILREALTSAYYSTFFQRTLDKFFA